MSSASDGVGSVAVLSNASNFHREPGRSALTGLLGIAALLRTHTGLTATAQLVTADDTEELVTALRQAALDFPGGIYLVHTDPARASAAQAALTGTAAVITDQQTTAVTLIAAALTTLTRAGAARAAGRLVIVGAEQNPLVAALAVAAGIGEIDSWGPDDAHNFPMGTLSCRGAVVIDLLGVLGPAGPTTHRWPGDAPDSPTPVLAVEQTTSALLALPALLAATRHSGRPPDLGGHLMCAYALMECTPPDQVLPALSDPGLTDPALAAKIVAGGSARDTYFVR
jgi:hypothetical protein